MHSLSAVSTLGQASARWTSGDKQHTCEAYAPRVKLTRPYIVKCHSDLLLRSNLRRLRSWPATQCSRSVRAAAGSQNDTPRRVDARRLLFAQESALGVSAPAGFDSDENERQDSTLPRCPRAVVAQTQNSLCNTQARKRNGC